MNPNPTDIRKQFLSSLKRGTGEAYLILKNYPAIDFSDLIVKGATTNFAFDPQCEGSHAAYIFRLTKKSSKKEQITKAVLQKLETKKKEGWNLDQLCDLAVLFYKDGNSDAKNILQHRFEKNDIEGYEFCGQDQLMELYGLAGVLRVAESVGKRIVEQDDWEDSWRIDNFQKENKNVSVYKELERAGKDNKFIEAYYQSILKNKWDIPKRTRAKKISYNLIKEKIDANKFRFISVDKANDLSTEDVEKLAIEAFAETNKQRQEMYLRFFAKRKFPFDYKPLLKIAAGKNPSKTRLTKFAVDALSHFSGEDIRKLALKKLTDKRNPSDYLNLLVSNYENGDHKLLMDIIQRSDGYNYIHSIVFGIIEIYKKNDIKDCKEPLEMIYSKTNCGLCRKQIVKILHNNDVLYDSIVNELRFDSYDELRKRYTWLKKKR